jgi:hypothetical protein
MEEKTIHDVIGGMSDFERGWYHATTTTLWWNAAHQPVEMRMPLDWDEKKKLYLITNYSPTGNNKPAPSFYQQGQLAPDALAYYFDTEKFKAVWMELDYEASLMYYRLYEDVQIYSRIDGYEHHELVIHLSSTEDPDGLQAGWDQYPTDYVTPIRREHDLEHSNREELEQNKRDEDMAPEHP